MVRNWVLLYDFTEVKEMKFSEKLVNLRKQNKMSQEQLASMLDVSRQAVSKWESGTTYPEMDKLITMCKIFKCSLDDLTNDEVVDINFEEKKKGNFVFDTLDMVVKTLDMLKCMTFKQIVSCLFSMGLLAMVLLMLKLPVDYIIHLGNRVIIHFNFLPSSLSNIWTFLVTLAYLAICFVTLVYVFKSRYLDQFEYRSKTTINNKNEDKDMIKEKNTIEYVTISNNQNNSFFRVISFIVMILIKTIIVFLLVPLIATFVGLFAALILAIILLFRHVIYIGVILGIIFGILLNYVILELGYDFLFNKKPVVQRIFIMLIVAIAGIGISIGIFAYEVSITQFIDESPISDKQELIKEYEMNDKLYIYDLYYYNQEYISYEYDENLTDKVQFKVIYNDSYRNIDIRGYNDGVGIYFLNDNIINNKELLDLVIKDLSKKTIHNYNYLSDYKVVITSSSKNIEKIKANTEKKLTEERKQHEQERKNELEHQIASYEKENDKLISEIETLNNKISSLEETNNKLKTEIENYKEKIKEYKNNLNNLLEE